MKSRLVALDGHGVVEAAHTWLPLRDNRTLGYFFANYRPGSAESAAGGRRLGAAVKAANLLALHTHAPTVERIHTWNAEENAHMLAINDELGFRAAGVQGGWQLRR